MYNTCTAKIKTTDDNESRSGSGSGNENQNAEGNGVGVKKVRAGEKFTWSMKKMRNRTACLLQAPFRL